MFRLTWWSVVNNPICKAKRMWVQILNLGNRFHISQGVDKKKKKIHIFLVLVLNVFSSNNSNNNNIPASGCLGVK